VSTSTQALVGAELKPALLEAGILRETSVQGLYQRSALFESVVRGFESVIHQAGIDHGGYEPLVYLAPIIPRDTFVRTDYLRSFPDLLGSVDVFHGGDAEHADLLRVAEEGGDWSRSLAPSEVTMSSAACHTLYPEFAGTLPVGGRQVELQGFCFRHEPSPDPVRMQSFRMHEFLHVGSEASALEHRRTWVERAVDLLTGLGLPVDTVVANDPFFGRAGRLLARNQRDETLKFELVVPVTSEENPTAIASANYHLDHFSEPFDIKTADGGEAHSTCTAFGLERTALALFATHGIDAERWPAEVRDRLWP
jgi:seryl-tRNA synthetase